MSSSEVPTSYVDLTNSFDENGLNLTQTDRQSFLSYYRFYPLTVRALSTRVVETLGKGCYFLPSGESLGELSGDILSKFNAFISSGGSTLTSLGDTAFAYIGDVVYAVNYGGKITESLLDTKVNYSDALAYEEIVTTADLTNKVASASAVKEIGYRIRTGYFRVATTANTPVFVKDNFLSGTLPPTINTYFTIVTNSSSVSHTTTLFFDESNADKLIIISNFSQNVGVNWVSFI